MPETPIPSADPLSPALSCCLCGGPAGGAGLVYPDGICNYLVNCFLHSGGANRLTLAVNGIGQTVDFTALGGGDSGSGGFSAWADLGTGCTPDPTHSSYDFFWLLSCTTDPATGKRVLYLSWVKNCFHSSTDVSIGNGIRGVLNSVNPLSVSFHDHLVLDPTNPPPESGGPVCTDCPPPTITAALTGTPVVAGGGCVYP
jgi:hypothetical protein